VQRSTSATDLALLRPRLPLSRVVERLHPLRVDADSRKRVPRRFGLQSTDTRDLNVEEIESTLDARPRATTLLPVNASAGRFVIVCMENTTADNRVSSHGVYPFPAATYVPTQLEIR
jgi:hypothetical protein